MGDEPFNYQLQEIFDLKIWWLVFRDDVGRDVARALGRAWKVHVLLKYSRVNIFLFEVERHENSIYKSIGDQSKNIQTPSGLGHLKCNSIKHFEEHSEFPVVKFSHIVKAS